MTTYFDSSAIVALYVPEAFSARCGMLARDVGQIPFTCLHELEIHTALRVRHGRGALTAQQLRAVLSDLDSDVRAGRLADTSIDLPELFKRARELSSSHAARLLCRSLDVLHVAAAVGLDCHEFVSGDDRQLALAQAAGLSVRDVKRATTIKAGKRRRTP